MSSAKSDKILQESEKILTNPAETGRICPIFPGGQGAMRLGLSSCSDRRECAYMQSLHLMISWHLQRAQRLCIYAIPAPNVSWQLQQAQGMCSIPCPGRCTVTKKSAPEETLLRTIVFRQQTFSVRKRYVLLPL